MSAVSCGFDKKNVLKDDFFIEWCFLICQHRITVLTMTQLNNKYSSSLVYYSWMKENLNIYFTARTLSLALLLWYSWISSFCILNYFNFTWLGYLFHSVSQWKVLDVFTRCLFNSLWTFIEQSFDRPCTSLRFMLQYLKFGLTLSSVVCLNSTAFVTNLDYRKHSVRLNRLNRVHLKHIHLYL